MALAEPTTTLTDWVLGIQALWLGARLRRLRGENRDAARGLGSALLATGVGALVGGASHGFAPWLEGTLWDPLLWKITMLCIGLTSLLFLRAVGRAALAPRARRWLDTFALLEFVIYALWILRDDAFLWAIVDYLPAMIVALVLFGAQAIAGRPGGRAIAGGILLTLVGAAVQASGFALHEHFNHNDLFHVIQMVAVWALFRGGRQLTDAGAIGGGKETDR